MAFATIPPHMAAAMNRANAERDAMNSPDPVTRYRAKERAANRAFAEIGAGYTIPAIHTHSLRLFLSYPPNADHCPFRQQ